MHYNDVCHSPGYDGFDLIFDICDYNQVLCRDTFHQLYLNKSNQHFHLCWVVLFFFISFYYIHLQTSLHHYSLPGSFHIHCENFFLKVRLLLDYSDLHKNLSKIAILWSYCSHKFSPIPIKLLLLFVEIDHHIQYLWYMQVVTSFPWMICLKQVVSSHQKNVYHFNGLVDNPLCKPIKLILAKYDISHTIPLYLIIDISNIVELWNKLTMT